MAKTTRSRGTTKTRRKVVGRVPKVTDGIAPSVAGEQPRCLQLAKRGVQTGSDFAGLMSALMSDLLEGKITPQVGNATVNAGGKLLKVVEMQLKFGTAKPDGSNRTLDLIES